MAVPETSRDVWSKKAFWSMILGFIAVALGIFWAFAGLLLGVAAIQQGATARGEWRPEDLRNRWQAETAIVLGGLAVLFAGAGLLLRAAGAA